MTALSRIFTFAFDGLVAPFGSHRTAALVVLSLLSGALLAVLYKATSNQARIRHTRELFKARILEMRLYPDDIVLITKALFGAIAAQGAYLRAAFRPIVVVLVVALPIFFQLEARFAPAPKSPGERFLVHTMLKEGLDVRDADVTLAGTPSLRVDPRPVRAPATRSIIWRVDVLDSADAALTLNAYGTPYRVPVVFEHHPRAVGTTRKAHSFVDPLLHPGLPPIPANSPVAAVSVEYDEDAYDVLRTRMGWLSVFLLGSLVGAIVPAWILRIQL